MYDILHTINLIEDKKWSLLNAASKIPINNSVVPMSDLTVYSNPKHKEVDDVDDSFARSLFPFFLFLIPQTIVLTLFLKAVFYCIYQKKISIYIRRYFFTAACLWQILIEGNIAYFTYIFFRQMMVGFSSKFVDKVFLGASIVAFGCILLIAFCSYLMFNKYYGKTFGYFIYCFYRSLPSMVLLTVRFFVRGFIRGVIHSTLHYKYGVAITLLCLLEGLVIATIIYLEKKYKVFINRTMFCVFLLYHFLLILFNLVIYGEKVVKDSQLS